MAFRGVLDMHDLKFCSHLSFPDSVLRWCVPIHVTEMEKLLLIKFIVEYDVIVILVWVVNANN